MVAHEEPHMGRRTIHILLETFALNTLDNGFDTRKVPSAPKNRMRLSLRPELLPDLSLAQTVRTRWAAKCGTAWQQQLPNLTDITQLHAETVTASINAKLCSTHALMSGTHTRPRTALSQQGVAVGVILLPLHAGIPCHQIYTYLWPRSPACRVATRQHASPSGHDHGRVH